VANHTEINQLVDHLFRHESGKMVAVLTRIFGPENIDLAEDVVQDALVEAISQWAYNIPQNPSAWLYKVAKNKALNVINRNKYKRKYQSDIIHFLKSEWTIEPAMDHFFSEQEIADDQLRMMFTCCYPAISSDSQVALILKTLCGFSIPEIARAFLTTEDTINKRLVRARQNIREANISFEVPAGEELDKRLDTVLETIYLLFNEGYSASSGDKLIRYELCEEAIRLTEMIVSHHAISDNSNTAALLALMLLNASRFASRLDRDGNILQMQDQDRTLWDLSLMERGFYYLRNSASANGISSYHILAAISSYHCSAPDFNSTDWSSILSLYDKLLLIDDSPIVILNRTVALSKVEGPLEAIAELEKIKDNPAFKQYHLFYSTQAEFYIQANQYPDAVNCLEKAIRLASVKAEQGLLQKRLNSCKEKIT